MCVDVARAGASAPPTVTDRPTDETRDATRASRRASSRRSSSPSPRVDERRAHAADVGSARTVRDMYFRVFRSRDTNLTNHDSRLHEGRPVSPKSPIAPARARADAVAARATPREMTHTHTQTPSRATLHSRCPRATPAAVECESARARQSQNQSDIKKTPESTWNLHGTDGDDKVIHSFLCVRRHRRRRRRRC